LNLSFRSNYSIKDEGLAKLGEGLSTLQNLTTLDMNLR
jgi:hypothetical protein